ncbi:MAG: DUF262 domain-containing HNH endonuclease family protein [Candidatus Paceibacterota bacterium]
MTEIHPDKIKLVSILGEEGKVYKIPPFQRSYTWDLDILQELWNDILENVVNPEGAREHFTGVFIFANEDDPTTSSELVIDGQQRLTSFTILLRAMYDHLSDREGHLGSDIYETIMEGEVGKKSYPRLVLGDDVREFFFKYIQVKDTTVYRKAKKGKKKVEKRIVAAYKFFEDKISKEAESRQMTSEKFVDLLFNRLEKRIVAVKIKVSSDTDAYTVFETINSKKVELSVSELLKNYLFQQSDRIGDSELEKTKKKWEEIIDNLESEETEPSQYIRHFWLSNFVSVTDKKLYLVIKTYCKGQDKKLKDLIRDLATQSSQYGKLVSATREDDDRVIDLDAVILLSQIKALRIKQCYPLLLSALSTDMTAGEFKALLRGVIKVSLTRSLIDKNPNELEKIYEKNALLLRKNGKTHLEQTLKEIDAAAPSLDDLVNDLLLPDSSVSELLAKFLLIQIELKERTDETTLNRVSLEHLLPKNPDDITEWGMSKDEHEKYVGKLGNLALVGGKINSKASNKAFAEKKKILVKSDLKTTVALVKSKKKWTMADIEFRTKELAKFAMSNWK